ncbi:hypothetical protein J6590_078838 [Homalodisca vitripennis]|nr:hypothetical protein J6590_078838 [Homalodisca vitripennis]
MVRASSEKVGWIYNLKKPELTEEMSKYGLPIEGNKKDLRSRFVTFLRSQGLVRTPSTYPKSLDNTLLGVQGTSTIPVSTLNTRVEDSSQLELASFREILGLSPSASAETKAEYYESYESERLLYKPPPNPAQTLVPETAYYLKIKQVSMEGMSNSTPLPGHGKIM